MTTQPKNLGIRGIDSIEMVAKDLQRSEAFYSGKMGFRAAAASNVLHEGDTGEAAVVFEAGRIRIQCSTAADRSSGAASFLRRHPEGVRTIALRVDDVEAAWRTLEGRGANILDEIQGGPGARWFAIASPLGDVEFRFIERGAETRNPHGPGFDAVARSGDGKNGHQFTHVDHITSNTREIRSVTDWYRDVLGFEHFWDIRFHTRDVNPGMRGGSGLNSIVMRDPDSDIKFATNEPLRPEYRASQIAKFVEDNRGPGVQHVALGTKSITDAVPALRKAGVQFLSAPDAYYKMLPGRLAERAVTELKEDVAELRRNDILVDGEKGRYLLQIFMQECALLYNDQDAGPFFHEVIQRRGHPGFGEGNFRALFESIEKHQATATGPSW